MSDERTELLGLAPCELEALSARLGQPAYRAGQVFGWLHRQQVSSIAQMLNLPAGFRASLE